VSFFSYMFNAESSRTILIYICITFISFLFGTVSQKIVTNKYSNEVTVRVRKLWYLIACFLLWFFSFFNCVGNDYPMYLSIYEESTFELIARNIFVEPGFRMLCVLIKLIVSDARIGIGLIKTITLLLIFITIYKFRDRIHIGLALLAYVSIFYFESYSLIRSNLAAAMVLFSIALIIEKKNIFALTIMILSMTIHYSAAISLVFYFIFIGLRKINVRKLVIIMLTAALFMVFLSDTVLRYLSYNVSYFAKYRNYIATGSSFGIMQIIYYIPIFITIFYTYSNQKTTTQHCSIILVFMGLAIALIGYRSGMVSRMNVYFLYNYVILIPYFVFQVKLRYWTRNDKEILYISRNYKLGYQLTLVIALFYFCVRFILDTTGYMNASGIYPLKLWI